MRIRYTLGFATFMVGIVPALFSQQLPKCATEKVQYKAQPSDLASKIHLTAFSAADTFPKSLKRQNSIQGTRWVAMTDPGYINPGPWNTTLFIGDAGEANPFLKLHIADHGNTLTMNWINEKLLFVQVWWGRFASSDLIFDIEQRKLIYNEFAHYGELGEPCKD